MKTPCENRGRYRTFGENADALASVFILAQKRSEVLQRRLRRLCTMSDKVAEYKAIRRPRGHYITPLLEDPR